MRPKNETIRISRACNNTERKINGVKKVSKHHKKFTYQYLRCMHGAELSHQKGHLKDHLRTAGWGDNVGRKNRGKIRKYIIFEMCFD